VSVLRENKYGEKKEVIGVYKGTKAHLEIGRDSSRLDKETRRQKTDISFQFITS
jgi:hypothetical protein